MVHLRDEQDSSEQADAALADAIAAFLDENTDVYLAQLATGQQTVLGSEAR